MADLAFCKPDDLAGGACRTLGVCWGHECVGFADCPCARCRQTRTTATANHRDHSTPDYNYCGACRTARNVCWRGECRNGCAYPDVCSERCVVTTYSCMVPDTLRGVRMSHSDDLVAVWHGYAEPALACGFHAKFYAQEVYAAHRELMGVTR